SHSLGHRTNARVGERCARSGASGEGSVNYPIRCGELMNFSGIVERDDWQIESWGSKAQCSGANSEHLPRSSGSGCFRLELSPGGTCSHWKAPPCHGAHAEQTSRVQV